MKLKDRIVNMFELKGGMNGLKMIIGAALIVAAHQIEALRDVALNYPDLVGNVDWLVAILEKVIGVLTWLMEKGGQILVFIGTLSKGYKFFKK